MAPSTMSWHGQAEQPMMLRGRSVLAGVPDAQGTQPWTRVARRVWSAAVWPQSMWSGSSRWPCGMLVWWAPRHDGVARPRQVRWCAAGIGTLGSELARLKRMQRRRGGALALLRTSTIRPKTRGRAAGRLSRARDRYRTAQGVRAVHRWSEARLGALEKEIGLELPWVHSPQVAHILT